MIPKIIHQIWINSNPALPAEFEKYANGWRKNHPDWQYKLWNLENLDFLPRHSNLIAEAKSYAQKADILRYEILYNHGGVYIDTDFECLRPISNLIDGISNFACSEDGVYLTNAIIGAAPKSKYMARLIDGMPSAVGNDPPNVETGPVYFTKKIIGRGLDSDFKIFPSEFFYPYNYNEKPKLPSDCTESYAIHHWAHSWRSDNFLKTLARKLFKTK